MFDAGVKGGSILLIAKNMMIDLVKMLRNVAVPSEVSLRTWSRTNSTITVCGALITRSFEFFTDSTENQQASTKREALA